VPEQRHPVPIEHLRHRRLGQTQVEVDPVQQPPFGEAQRDDVSLRALCRVRRRVVRFGHGVDQTRPPIGLVPADPFGDGGARHLQAFSDAGLHPTVLDDQFNELGAPCWGQWRVEVGDVRDAGLRGIA